ncbi:MAG: LysR family transcriptional regulator [Gammaproteobacteria bacterium]|nr:LysR family transcriptional regulator [Gammaproteobacteria bacterium]
MKAPRITLDQWKTLQAVIDHGGFAQAAQALHCSQSSVSYSIARMQEQLCMPLLRIEGRKAVLTPTGEVLLRRSRQLTADAAQLESLAQQIQEGWEAEVRLVVDAAYPSQKIVQALQAFKPLSRGCRVLLREEVLSGTEEVLNDGAADIALSGVKIIGYLPIELGTISFIAVAHNQHPLHQLGRKLDATDLAAHMQVVVRDSGRRQPRDTGWLGAEQRWTVASVATSAEFIRAGLGFAWLPEHIIAADLASGVLKQLLLETSSIRHEPFFLYSHKDKPLGKAAKILIDCIQASAAPFNGNNTD